MKSKIAVYLLSCVVFSLLTACDAIGTVSDSVLDVDGIPKLEPGISKTGWGDSLYCFTAAANTVYTITFAIADNRHSDYEISAVRSSDINNILFNKEWNSGTGIITQNISGVDYDSTIIITIDAYYENEVSSDFIIFYNQGTESPLPSGSIRLEQGDRQTGHGDSLYYFPAAENTGYTITFTVTVNYAYDYVISAVRASDINDNLFYAESHTYGTITQHISAVDYDSTIIIKIDSKSDGLNALFLISYNKEAP